MPDLGLGPGTEMVALFFALLALRVPVAFALGLSALWAMARLGFGLDLVGDLIAASVARFSLLAIPFFILAGTLMGRTGIAERMIRFFRVLVGPLPGGMGLVGTVVCLFWGAVSGSGPASVAAIGPLVIRSMEEDGYRRPFAAGLVCAGAALSIVIPPSIGLVVYGVIAETSIAALFAAAVVPGLLMLCALPFGKRAGAATGGALAALAGAEPHAGRPYAERLARAFREAFWGLMTPVVILGGIYSGAFTPTEAAIVATAYALLVGGLIHRTLSWRGLYDAFADAAAASATVMLVVAYASLFGWVVAVDDLVGRYSEALLGMGGGEAGVLAAVMLILLVAGMFMDAITIMFVALPILLPVARELGWDPVWFGVLVMVNLAVGLFTPPVGINLYVAANITRLPLETVARGALPFLVTTLLGLALLAALPELTLAPGRALGGGAP